MKTAIVFLLLALFVAGCASRPQQKYTHWEPDLLAGLRLKTSDPLIAGFLNFERSTARVSTGWPKWGDGQIMGWRTLTWQIDGEWLVLLNERGGLERELRVVSVGHFFLIAQTRDGKNIRFTYDEELARDEDLLTRR